MFVSFAELGPPAWCFSFSGSRVGGNFGAFLCHFQMDFAPENFRFLVLSLLVKTRTIKSDHVWRWFGSGWLQSPGDTISVATAAQDSTRHSQQELQALKFRSLPKGPSWPVGDRLGQGVLAGPRSVRPWRELLTNGALWCANGLNDVSFPQNAAHNHSNYTWQSLIIAFPFNQFLLKYSFCARIQLIFPIDVSQALAIFLWEDQSEPRTGWHATFLGGSNF